MTQEEALQPAREEPREKGGEPSQEEEKKEIVEEVDEDEVDSERLVVVRSISRHRLTQAQIEQWRRILRGERKPLDEEAKLEPSSSQSVKRGKKRAKATVLGSKKKEKKPRKRRFRQCSDVMSRDKSEATLGVTWIGIDLQSLCMFTAKRTIVSALATMLPLDAKLSVFGFMLPVVIVGVLYRNGSLCWLFVNRINAKLYLSAHFVADALHLYNVLRLGSHIQIPEHHKTRKWTRQGVNDVLCIYENLEAMQTRSSEFRLNVLPDSVLQFKPTDFSLRQTREFLMMSGHGGIILRLFTRRQPLPSDYTPRLPDELAKLTPGWKVFKHTKPQGCLTAKRACDCIRLTKCLVREGIADLSPNQGVMKMLYSLPSSLDKDSAAPLRAHYQGIINRIRDDPGYLMFPTEDVHLPTP